MPSIRRCFLCKYKYVPKNAHIMMHSFPCCEDVKKKWMKVCNILPKDDVTRLYICSQHFRPENYYKPHSFSTKYQLSIGAVPSRKVINTVGTGFKSSFKSLSTNYVEKIPELEVHAELGGISETTVNSPSTGYDTVRYGTEMEVHMELGRTSETTVDLPSTSYESVAELEIHAELGETSQTTVVLPSTSYNKNDTVQCRTEMEVHSDLEGTSETTVNSPSTIYDTVRYGTQMEFHAELEGTTETTIDLPSTSYDGQSTPKRRRFVEPRYINEISPTHVRTPRRAKRVIDMVKRNYKNQSIKIKQLQDARRLLHKKVQNLEDMVAHLKRKNLLSDKAGEEMLQLLPDTMREVMKRHLKGSHKYSEKIRCFALTLHFYSPRAYLYVRSVWKNLLPHPSTIKQWYRVVNGAPGFTAEAFNAIKIKAAEKKTFINICVDEMSIREQIIFNNNRFYGGIEFGSNTNDSFDMDNIPLAKYALVFMAVPINDHWKIPVGYFLISGLTGKERSKLLIQCIELINETGAMVHSITFDGAPSNIKMCTELGACYEIDNLNPYFKIPSCPHYIYTFFDICHMIKLVRNTFGDKRLLKHKQEFIKWEFIERLHKLQSEEGLRLANKLTKKHIHFDNHRMNVRIACQTLSASVSKSLLFLKQSNHAIFKYSQATSDFCKTFNDIMDVLNCKNKFSKTGYNIPLNKENFIALQKFAKSAEEYIRTLTDVNGCPILKSPRKIGFLGIIIDLRIIFTLFEDLNNLGLEYLLTYKVNQDYLETFFSAIRARGGFNNNPNSLQFQSAYKRLLLRMELKQIETGNCLFDGIDILHVSSKHIKESIDIEEVEEPSPIHSHDYLLTAWTLSPFVEDVISYMAGYVVSKVLKTLRCEICMKCLTSEDQYHFIELKKYSDKFVTPSKDVVIICRESEKLIRQMTNNFKVKNSIMYLNNKILKNVRSVFCNNSMIDHIKKQDILDNHRILLIKKIIDAFLNARLHYEAKKASQKPEYVRQKLHKLILFKNQ